MASMNTEEARSGFTDMELTKAVALLRLLVTDRAQTDPAFLLAVFARFNKLPEDLKMAADLEVQRNPTGSGPIRRGRRLDLETEYERRRRENPNEKQPLIVRVLIAGSGYNGWATQVKAAA